MDYAEYKRHLDRVSRSFSFCIDELQPPYREWVALAYLLLRILDTVEDADWADREAQRKQFEELEKFFETLPSPEEATRWGARFPKGLSEGEREVIADVRPILEDIQALPEQPRRYLLHTARSMSAGMQHFQFRDAERGLRVKNIRELNYYCFFAAGVIGELLIALLALLNKNLVCDDERIIGSYSLGLTLQKVNILKDQDQDAQLDKSYLFDRQEVIDSLRENIECAFAFIKGLPLEEREFRLFCSWSFFLGMASIYFVEKSHRDGQPHKIAREQTRLLLAMVRERIDDNDALEELFRRGQVEGIALFQDQPQEVRAADPWRDAQTDDELFRLADDFRQEFKKLREAAPQRTR